MDRWSYVRAAAQAERAHLAPDPLIAGSPGAGAPPVGLRLAEALLARRGYDVARYPAGHPLLAGAWAALFPEMELAACDGSLSRQRQAFALAHELAHLVLHESLASPEHAGCGAGEIDAEADPRDASRGSLEVYNPRQQRELEANVFALHLLLPRPLLWCLFVQDGLDARAIADRLDVSHTATLQALAGLLLPEYAGAALASGSGVERPLDESQRAAATAEGSPVLVQAGPGTGKTGTLVGRVRYLVEEHDQAPDRLLVLTFSNRAVGELQGRLLGALGLRARALTVSTFHSFAHEVLRRYSAAAGLPADFRVLDRPALLILLRAGLAQDPPPALLEWISLDRPMGALAGLIEVAGRLKEELIDAATFRRLTAEAPQRAEQADADRERATRQAAFYAWYDRVLAGAGVLDYADLVLRAVLLLRSRADIRAEVQAQYPHLLVDEYQDINQASAALLLALSATDSGASTLWAVGDPHQSIYRWRGAMPEVLHPFAARETGATPSLQVNYRSLGPIVRLCGGVAAALDDLPVEAGRRQWRSARGEPHAADAPYPAAIAAPDPVPCITLATAPDGLAELEGIVREIRRGIDAGRAAADHAVLCATNAQAEAVATALRGHGLPVCREGDPANDPAVRRALGVLTVAAGDAEALLRLAIDDGTPGDGAPSTAATPAPAGERADERHSATVPRGDPADSLPRLASTSALILIQEVRARGEGVLTTLGHPPQTLSPAQQEAARTWASFLWSLRLAGNAADGERGASWAALARYLFDGPTAAARPLLTEDAAGYPALAALLAAARAYDATPAALRAPSLPAHVRLLVETGDGLSPAGDAALYGPGVRVLTVHAAKGLEFPVVFVPNLARDRFPGRGRAGQALAVAVPAIDEVAARAADERCLFFVALSRARDHLVLSRAERYGGRAAGPSALLALADPALALEPPAIIRWSASADAPGETAPSRESPGQDPSCGDHNLQVPPESPIVPVEIDAQDLEIYVQCPRRYYYGAHLGLRGDDEHGFPHFQRTLRRALARLHEMPAPDRKMERDAAPASGQRALDILHEEWAAEHAPHPYEDLYLERARRIIAGRRSHPGVASIHDAEYQVVRPEGVIRVRIDRVDRPEQAPPVAVRYRSGRAHDEHRRDYRTALYNAALQEAHGAGSVYQEYLATSTVDAAQARAGTIAARLRECDSALAGIARGSFPARPGEQCRSCPFWLICPAG